MPEPSSDQLAVGTQVCLLADCYVGLSRGARGRVLSGMPDESLVLFEADNSKRLVVNDNLETVS